VRWRYFIPIIIGLAILSGCVQPVPTPPPSGQNEAQPTVAPTLPCKKTELIYQRQIFWSQEEFSKICTDKTGFENDFEAEITALSKKYRITTGEFEFSFAQETYSTIAGCRIDGAISNSGDGCRGRFGWLLEPLGLDFINDNFEESKTGLSWEGIINSTPITIEVECPPQDRVYEAWQDTVGHCHQHIWWPASSQKETVKCIETRRHT